MAASSVGGAVERRRERLSVPRVVPCELGARAASPPCVTSWTVLVLVLVLHTPNRMGQIICLDKGWLLCSIWALKVISSCFFSPLWLLLLFLKNISENWELSVCYSSNSNNNNRRKKHTLDDSMSSKKYWNWIILSNQEIQLHLKHVD